MSNIYEYIKMAIHNIMANKGRSFLTMLGIIIGIASVIAIVSIGEGTKNQMNSEINDIGGGDGHASLPLQCKPSANGIVATGGVMRYSFGKIRPPSPRTGIPSCAQP